MKKTFLITGGAGFIGSNLIDKLIFYGEDIDIICVDNFDSSYSEKFKQNNICLHRRMRNYRLYVADINNYSALNKIFKSHKITHIVHLAAKTSVQLSIEQPEEFFKTNVNGTLNLLQLAKDFCVEKFIFASSGSVYGAVQDLPFNENMKISNPISPYAASKAAGEQLCHTYSHLYGINIVCLRLFSVYGRKQSPNSAIHKFSRLIAEGKALQIYTHGEIIRDFCYIDDAIQGILAAIDYNKSEFKIINIGKSEPVKLDTVITLLEENLGKKAIIEKRLLPPGELPASYADISKAKRLLSYQPNTSIETGIKKFVSWFKEFYNYFPYGEETVHK